MLFVLGDLAICLHGCTWATLGTRTLFDWKCGVSVFHSCNIRIVWGLWSQSNFHDMIISIINIFWLHWIINRLVVMHPYALSHNKAVLNWNNFVWSIRLILIQGLIAFHYCRFINATALSNYRTFKFIKMSVLFSAQKRQIWICWYKGKYEYPNGPMNLKVL